MHKVTFARSKKEVAWSDQYRSLLECGQANGVEIDYCCESGIDGVCCTRLLSGEVRYIDEAYYEPEPGHILVCIAVPRTDVVLDA
jgi:uncharacterized protein